MEVIDFFDRGVSLAPDAPCLVDENGSWAYRDVQRVTMRVASALLRDGVSRGTHVAVISHNESVAFMCVLGAIRAQTVWVPVNPRYSSQDIADQLVAFDCEFVFYHSNYAPSIAALKKQADKLRGAVCIDAHCGDDPSLERWLEGAADVFESEPADPHDVIVLLTTGGTTGKPKGVMQTHLAIETSIATYLVGLPLSQTRRYLTAAPMSHAAGIRALPTFVSGGTVYMVKAAKADLVADAIERYGITEVILPVTVVYSMLADPVARAADYRSLEYLYYATAPMSESKLREALELFGPVMFQGWGQSESIATCTFLTREDHFVNNEIAPEQRLRSCGRQTPFMKTAVMDPAGKLLGPDEVGEFVTRGNGVMKGYYKDPEATAEASRFGWHHTGDVGYYDAQGYYYIVDRAKDMIISGGFNIFPSEIERVLNGHPAVQNVAVIGVPDDRWGERVTAVVELKPGTTVTAEDLIGVCRARLGSIKAPKAVEFLPELPLSPAGKVLKREVREKYWAGATRRV